MIFLIYCLLATLGYFIILPKLFALAGENPTYGYIPVYRDIVWLKIVGHKKWYVIFLFVPGVNLLMLASMNYELTRVFGYRSTKDVLLAIFVPFVHFMLILRDPNLKYHGPVTYDKNNKKPMWMEWRDAAVYATIAATTLNLFTFQAYTIPTGSMEGSLLTGDYLFVSKFHYGARMPITPLGVPFTQNRLPGGMTPSYLEWVTLPYYRLPGFSEVKRNDPMVFNFPANDTFIVDEELSTHTYYDIIRRAAFGYAGENLNEFRKNENNYMKAARQFYERNYGISTRPIDRRENYVKRCVALPGDLLEIKGGQVYINGQMGENPEKMQFNYLVRIATRVAPEFWPELGVRSSDTTYIDGNIKKTLIVPLSQAQAEKVRRQPGVASIQPAFKASGADANTLNMMFPQSFDAPYKNWTLDNYGPIKMPSAGETVELNIQNLPLYKRIITAYELHDLKVVGQDIFIDGIKTNSYTFLQNYYWLMGDNRHNSVDSRYWGFVPEDHIIGKPTLIWFSKEPGEDIRWDRMFSIPE